MCTMLLKECWLLTRKSIFPTPLSLVLVFGKPLLYVVVFEGAFWVNPPVQLYGGADVQPNNFRLTGLGPTPRCRSTLRASTMLWAGSPPNEPVAGASRPRALPTNERSPSYRSEEHTSELQSHSF